MEELKEKALAAIDSIVHDASMSTQAKIDCLMDLKAEINDSIARLDVIELED